MIPIASKLVFEWDKEKDLENQVKHGVSFIEARKVFEDRKRVIIKDIYHSDIEERFYCLGLIGNRVLTVRFTYRDRKIRIFGAGYWRKGKRIYEK